MVVISSIKQIDEETQKELTNLRVSNQRHAEEQAILQQVHESMKRDNATFKNEIQILRFQLEELTNLNIKLEEV
jgi:hypothetical protein